MVCINDAPSVDDVTRSVAFMTPTEKFFSDPASQLAIAENNTALSSIRGMSVDGELESITESHSSFSMYSSFSKSQRTASIGIMEQNSPSYSSLSWRNTNSTPRLRRGTSLSRSSFSMYKDEVACRFFACLNPTALQLLTVFYNRRIISCKPLLGVI